MKSFNIKRLLISFSVLGIILTVMGISDIISTAAFKSDIQKAYEEGKNDINIMTSSEYTNKQNVYGSILYLYDCYCEETTTKTSYGVETSSSVTGRYYLMPITSENEDEEKYITIVINNSANALAVEEIMYDTWDYFNGEENIEWHDYFLMGKVKPLEDDARQYLLEWFKENEWFETNNDSELNKHIVPYEIVEYLPDNISKNGKIALIVGLIFIAVVAVVFIVSLPKKSSQVSSEQYASANGHSYQVIKQPRIDPDDFFNTPNNTVNSYAPPTNPENEYSKTPEADITTEDK